MSRQARIILPGFPHHVIHRGHSDGTIFSGDRDYLAYLSNLRELKERFNVRVLAYCLLLNHVHLLLEPVYDAADLIRLMKNLAGRATQYWNRLHNSSGSLWQGRYRSSLVKRDYFLLACCRYIELNPVRWQMV